MVVVLMLRNGGFMKKIVCLLLVVSLIVSGIYISPVHADAKTSDVVYTAYRKFLKKQKKRIKKENDVDYKLYFHYMDINKDGIKELFIVDKSYYDFGVYTYWNGKVRCLAEKWTGGGNWFSMYITGKYFIRHAHAAYDENWDTVSVIRKGKLKHIVTFSQEIKEYTINDKKTTKKKYEKMQQKWFKRWREKGTDYYIFKNKLTEKNIAEVK